MKKKKKDKLTIIFISSIIAVVALVWIYALVYINNQQHLNTSSSQTAVNNINGSSSSRSITLPSPISLLTATTVRIPKGGKQFDPHNYYTNNEEPLIYGTVAKSILNTENQILVSISVYYPNGTLYLQRVAAVSPSDGYYNA